MDDHDHEEKEIKPRKRTPIRRQLALTAGVFGKPKVYLKPVINPQDKEKNMSGT